MAKCERIYKVQIGLLKDLSCLSYVYGYSACMYVHVPNTKHLRKTKEGVGCPGTGVTDSGESPCGCWDSNTGPLGNHQVFLTSEPSLQPPA